MWKASIGAKPADIKVPDTNSNDDEWETDPDFINDVDEQEQRWGSKTVEGSGRQLGAIDMQKLRQETEEAEAQRKQKQLEEGPNPSFGYGGKFGIEKDRMDRSAVGHDYVAKIEKHVSQKDYSSGFGGKYGVQTDRIDKSAVNWDYKEKIEKHSSQKDYSAGFGGKYGVQVDRQDKSAVGWDHVEKVDKHESQKDYNVGFGGKYGVQLDRQDKSAVGWDHHETLPHHESQVDHKKGFGGKFGVQTDRMDKSAVAFTEEPERVGTTYTRERPDIGGAKPSDVRAKFESMIQCEPPTVKEVERKPVKQLSSTKVAMFSNQTTTTTTTNSNTNTEQIQTKVTDSTINKTTVNEETVKQIENENKVTTNDTKKEEAVAKDEELPEIEDTGLVAVALYDYQSAADDEISFDPEDIITHIEMIDEGWWRGLCRGRYGLFPANYVQLQQ